MVQGFIEGTVKDKRGEMCEHLNSYKGSTCHDIIAIEDRNPFKELKNRKAFLLDAENGRLLATSFMRSERQKTQSSILADPKDRISSDKVAYVNCVPHEIFMKFTKENEKSSKRISFLWTFLESIS
jgi:hypothetical protein